MSEKAIDNVLKDIIDANKKRKLERLSVKDRFKSYKANLEANKQRRQEQAEMKDAYIEAVAFLTDPRYQDHLKFLEECKVNLDIILRKSALEGDKIRASGVAQTLLFIENWIERPKIAVKQWESFAKEAKDAQKR